MPQNLSEISFLIIATTILVLVMTSFVVFMVFLHRNRQLKHRQLMVEAKAQYEEAVMLSRLEMQEQTLNHISGEIHDNIGQVLSFVKLSLNTAKNLTEADKQKRIDESKDLLSRVIDDLRDLSKSFSFTQIKKFGVSEVIKDECDRFNRTGAVPVELEIEGNPYRLGEEKELLLFRIFQESINNAFKYSGTPVVKVFLRYEPNLFTLSLVDEGSGFDPHVALAKKGSGLSNIQTRAAVIGAHATIQSGPGEGCRITVTFKITSQVNVPNEDISNSAG